MSKNNNYKDVEWNNFRLNLFNIYDSISKTQFYMYLDNSITESKWGLGNNSSKLTISIRNPKTLNFQSQFEFGYNEIIQFLESYEKLSKNGLDKVFKNGGMFQIVKVGFNRKKDINFIFNTSSTGGPKVKIELVDPTNSLATKISTFLSPFQFSNIYKIFSEFKENFLMISSNYVNICNQNRIEKNINKLKNEFYTRVEEISIKSSSIITESLNQISLTLQQNLNTLISNEVENLRQNLREDNNYSNDKNNDTYLSCENEVNTLDEFDLLNEKISMEYFSNDESDEDIYNEENELDSISNIVNNTCDNNDEETESVPNVSDDNDESDDEIDEEKTNNNNSDDDTYEEYDWKNDPDIKINNIEDISEGTIDVSVFDRDYNPNNKKKNKKSEIIEEKNNNTNNTNETYVDTFAQDYFSDLDLDDVSLNLSDEERDEEKKNRNPATLFKVTKDKVGNNFIDNYMFSRLKSYQGCLSRFRNLMTKSNIKLYFPHEYIMSWSKIPFEQIEYIKEDPNFNFIQHTALMAWKGIIKQFLSVKETSIYPVPHCLAFDKKIDKYEHKETYEMITGMIYLNVIYNFYLYKRLGNLENKSIVNFKWFYMYVLANKLFTIPFILSIKPEQIDIKEMENDIVRIHKACMDCGGLNELIEYIKKDFQTEFTWNMEEILQEFHSLINAFKVKIQNLENERMLPGNINYQKLCEGFDIPLQKIQYGTIEEIRFSIMDILDEGDGIEYPEKQMNRERIVAFLELSKEYVKDDLKLEFMKNYIKKYDDIVPLLKSSEFPGELWYIKRILDLKPNIIKRNKTQVKKFLKIYINSEELFMTKQRVLTDYESSKPTLTENEDTTYDYFFNPILNEYKKSLKKGD